MLERRSLRRAPVAGVVAAPGPTGATNVAVIRNLSVGGALLAGGPFLSTSGRMRVLVYVAGGPALDFSARVLRKQVATREGEFAISFDKVEERQRAAIVRALDRHENKTRRPLAIIVAHGSQAPAALVRSVVALGLEPCVVGSPIEAAAWAQKTAAAVLVEEKLIEVDGWNLLRFLQEFRPEVKRVVIGGTVESFRVNLALRSGIAESLVEKPFSAASLAQRIGAAAPVARARRRAD